MVRVRDNNRAEIQAIGARAVNQAVNALILATTYLKGDGVNVVFSPEISDMSIDEMARTAIKLIEERT